MRSRGVCNNAAAGWTDVTLPRIHKQSRDFIHKWKSVLRLSDWQIDLRIVPFAKIKGVADCNATPKLMHATIRVARDGREHMGGPPYDLEQIIVHELLHCWFPGEEDVHQHSGVDALAWALVEKDREVRD